MVYVAADGALSTDLARAAWLDDAEAEAALADARSRQAALVNPIWSRSRKAVPPGVTG